MEVPFHASELSDSTQRFLFACAIRVLFANNNVLLDEKTWVREQFGARSIADLCKTFQVNVGDTGGEQFQRLIEGISHEELGEIRHLLRSWLMCCALSDGKLDGPESSLVNEIMAATSWENAPPPIPLDS